MDKVNNVELQVIGDKYHIFVNGVEIKQVSNVMAIIQCQLETLEEDIRSNIYKCNDLTRNIQETINKGGCQYGRING